MFDDCTIDSVTISDLLYDYHLHNSSVEGEDDYNVKDFESHNIVSQLSLIIDCSRKQFTNVAKASPHIH